MSTTNDLRGRAARLRGQLPPPPAGGHPPEDTGRRLATCPRGNGEELRISWCGVDSRKGLRRNRLSLF